MSAKLVSEGLLWGAAFGISSIWHKGGAVFGIPSIWHKGSAAFGIPSIWHKGFVFTWETKYKYF